MVMEKRKCELPGCDVEFELKPTGKQQRYCCTAHRNKHLALKEKELIKIAKGMGNIEPGAQEETAQVVEEKPATQINMFPSLPPKKTFLDEKEPPRASIPKPGAMDIHTQWVFENQRKEIDRWENAFNQEREARKKEHDEADKLRTELAELKTDRKIREIESEHKKPSGLQGFTSTVESLLANEHIAPHIGAILGKLLGTGGAMGQLPAGVDEQAQQAAMQIINWYGAQQADVQTNFNELINAIATQVKPDQLAPTLLRLVNVIKGGSSITKASATGTAGF